MALTSYLVDTSVLGRMTKSKVADRVVPLIAAQQVCRCAPVEFELLFMAQNVEELREIADELMSLPVVPTHEATFRRALEVQEQAAARGTHRSLPLVDLLVAAAAEAADLTVLHYDADFDRIAKLTGQPAEWVVRRGTAD